MAIAYARGSGSTAGVPETRADSKNSFGESRQRRELKERVEQVTGFLALTQRFLIGTRLFDDQDTLGEATNAGPSGGVVEISLLRQTDAKLVAELASGRVSLADLDEALRGNKDLVLAAFRHKMDSLQYASEALRGDREFLADVLRQKGSALKYASDGLRAFSHDL